MRASVAFSNKVILCRSQGISRINAFKGACLPWQDSIDRADIAWERGRPARILPLWPPLRFGAMLQEATLSAVSALGKPKERHGAVASGCKRGRWPKLCQALCGRDARAPGWPSSHEIVLPTGQKRRSILAPLVVEESPSVFVFIRVQEKVTPGVAPGSASRPTGA